MLTLLKLIVVASATCVYHDATRNRIGRAPGDHGYLNLPAGAWALGTLWLWIAFLPLYLARRPLLMERAREHPVEARHRQVKLGLFLLLFAALLLQGLFGGGAGTITFAEGVDDDLNTVNEGSEFSTGWVHMVIRGSEPFGDSALTVFERPKGAESWTPAEQHVVSPEWDMYSAPVLLDATGAYDIKVHTLAGTVQAYVLVFVHLGSRKVFASPATYTPDAAWVRQPEARCLRTPPRALTADSYAESFIGTLKHECLNHFVCFSPQQLDRIVSLWLAHYNARRPHQGREIGNNVLDADFRPQTGRARYAASASSAAS